MTHAGGSAELDGGSAPRSWWRRISLTQWILISMVVGTIIGWIWPHFGEQLQILSTVFLRMIKSLIVPLIFSTLVVGIAGHGDDMKRVGRLALRSIIYFELVTTVALVIGLATVNLVRPGVGITLPTEAGEVAQLANTHPTFTGVIIHTVPQSFFEAASTNEVLQIVFFAILFGVGLSRVQGKSRTVMLDFCQALSDTMFKFTGLVMAFAPIGIAGALAATVGKSGIVVLLSLSKLVLALYGALIVFIVFVLLPIAIMTRVPVRRFFNAVKEPYLIAFSTASSEAALPQAMEAMVEIGVPKRIVAFVMPTGYSFNLDGSTLYLALASVFAAQAAGMHMTLWEQVLMMLTLMLTSKGVAAVPRASLVILAGTLAQFQIPVTAVAVILGVDALMDMARTSVNLLGNSLATVVMARWEGEMGEPAETAKAA